MNVPSRYDFDFAIAGGGPAGSSAAISLAQRGHKVVLLERERFPRFHIGESLLASTAEALENLGLIEKIEAASFPEKWGARLITSDGAAGRGVDFTAVREIMRGQTWQVDRAEFDRILLQHARALGVDVREEHRVISCEFSSEAAAIEFETGSGERGNVRVRALVDASGRAGLMARKFDLRNDEPRLANIAIFAHYTGVPRLPDNRPDDIRLIACADAGWFWLIPISKDLMSVGVVFPKTLYTGLPQ
ncbi:MAG: NAD(P)/FAD-dependent oxidoreductase, partial [Thermoanaerobaculia bacterium]